MTDQELKDLARKYAEENPPQTEDEVLKQNGIGLNAKMVFEPFLRWLTKTHCIVSRDEVKEIYQRSNNYIGRYGDSENYHTAYCDGIINGFEEIFGTDLFEERGEK